MRRNGGERNEEDVGREGEANKENKTTKDKKKIQRKEEENEI